jgi:hypothetical protein
MMGKFLNWFRRLLRKRFMKSLIIKSKEVPGKYARLFLTFLTEKLR